jgi:hypothetical protein
VVVLGGDAVAQHRKEGLRRCAGGVLDRSSEERDTELFLGDQEVQDILLAVHMASDLVLGECLIDHGVAPVRVVLVYERR